MTLRDLSYIEAIARERSITRAAAKLFVAQPALSQCVQKVEKELGVPVFVRGSGGVSLTAEGEVFLAFARGTLKGQREMEQRLSDMKDEDGGQVRLGFTGTQAAYVLPYFLPQFKEKYPNVEIILVEASSDEIEEKLCRGEVEIGILHPPITCKELDSFELSHDEMVIVPRSFSRFHPYIRYRDGEALPYLDMDFLKDEPLIVTSPWQRSRIICEQIFSRAGITPIIKQTSKNLSTLDALAQVNYGTVILPSKQVSEALKRRGVYRIDPAFSIPYTFDAATVKNAYLPAAAGKLLELLKELRGTF